jgi:formate dehydrogenase subunit gamma
VKDRILRYGVTTRIVHWLIAASWILLFVSGLPLFHPYFYWTASLFGGGALMRLLHPFIGSGLTLLFAGYALSIWKENLLTAGDRAWLRGALAVMMRRREIRVDGKYNAGQKVMFWLLGVCTLGLTASGIVIWRPYFSGSFGADARQIATAAHAFFAFLMFAAVGVHVYAAFFTKGSITGMLRGTVSRAWAKTHHPGWYADIAAAEPKREPSDAE